MTKTWLAGRRGSDELAAWRGGGPGLGGVPAFWNLNPLTSRPAVAQYIGVILRVRGDVRVVLAGAGDDESAAFSDSRSSLVNYDESAAFGLDGEAGRVATELSREELAFIRAEFLPRFGTEPRIEDGILLRTWKAGERRGQPRIPTALASLTDSGLMVVRRDGDGPLFRAYFTAAGLAAMRAVLEQGRSFSRQSHGHLFEQMLVSSR